MTGKLVHDGHGLGRHPDPPDDRDFLWRAKMVREAVPLPPRYCLGSSGPMLDQGDTPQCVCFTAASVMLHQEWVEHRHYYNYDPNWLYQRCKLVDGIKGDGTVYRVALGVMKTVGLPARLQGGERYFTVGSYIRLTDVQQMKEAIFLSNGAVAVGMDIDSQWWKVTRAGIIGRPNDDVVGGHETAWEGWDDTVAGGAFRVKNSWGGGWADGGYAWLPYSHLDAYPGWDAWRTIDETSPTLP